LENSIAIPVIAGLAVGIVVVVLFAFYSSSPRDVVTGTANTGINIYLLGMKNQYSTIEPLNFTITYTGHGVFCSFDPTAKILDAQSGTLVYEVPTQGLSITCLDQPVDVNLRTTLYDFMYPSKPLLIGESGQYRLVVETYGVVLQKDFGVYELPT
jgi:hypothetical protein